MPRTRPGLSPGTYSQGLSPKSQRPYRHFDAVREREGDLAHAASETNKTSTESAPKHLHTLFAGYRVLHLGPAKKSSAGFAAAACMTSLWFVRQDGWSHANLLMRASNCFERDLMHVLSKLCITHIYIYIYIYIYI